MEQFSAISNEGTQSLVGVPAPVGESLLAVVQAASLGYMADAQGALR